MDENTTTTITSDVLPETTVDVAVIGGGAAGLSGALIDGSAITARRILVATGLVDMLPEIPGLAEHWGHSVLHCPYCHGWEVRDEPIGILATGPASINHALLFRQLSEDLVYLTHGTDLDGTSRDRFAARGIRVIDTPIAEVVDDEEGSLAGVRLVDGRTIDRRIIAVADADAAVGALAEERGRG